MHPDGMNARLADGLSIASHPTAQIALVRLMWRPATGHNLLFSGHGWLNTSTPKLTLLFDIDDGTDLSLYYHPASHPL